MRVKRTEIGPLTKLSEGGYAEVYRVPGFACRVTRRDGL